MNRSTNLLKIAGRGVDREFRELGFRLLGIDKTRPTIVRISLTDRCNFRCSYCDHWRRDRYANELSVAQWTAIIQSIAEFNPNAIIQFVGGEPFLRSDCFEIFSAAKESQIDWGVITNGFRLSKKDCFRLIQLNPLNVDISLDGATPKTHDKARGVIGSFLKITQGIQNLSERKLLCNKKISIRIKCTVHKLNIGELEDMVLFATGLGASSVEFTPMRGVDDDRSWLLPDANDVKKLKDVIERLCEAKAKGAPIETPISRLRDMCDHFLSAEKQFPATKEGVNSCRAPLRDLLISPSGEARFCWSYSDMGNASDASILDIWRSVENKNVRKSAVNCVKSGSSHCATTCISHRSFSENFRRAVDHVFLYR